MPTRHNDSTSYYKLTLIYCCPKTQCEQRFLSSFCSYFFECLIFSFIYKLVYLLPLKDVEGH